MSEVQAATLLKEIADFEEAWDQAKPDISDELRVSRGVWYLPAKRRLEHMRNVIRFKVEILNYLIERTRDGPAPLFRIQLSLNVPDSLTNTNLQPFLEALRELEKEGKVKIEREPGFALAASKDADLRPDGTLAHLVSTHNVPSHGYAGAVCSKCLIEMGE